MSITIRQIAEKAGVSRGTVDRVLNGRTGVKPEVRAKVLNIASALHYVPNVAAKALAYSKKPVLFGVIMPPREIAFFEEIRQGIQVAADELKDLGIRLAYHYVNNRAPEEAIQAIEQLIEQGASGIMFAVMDDDLIREQINRAVSLGIPVVAFNSDVEGSKRICFVGQDLYKSGRIAADLMSRVLPETTKLFIVTGTLKFQAHRSRVQGFVDWMKEHEQPHEIVSVIEGYDRYEDTLQLLDEGLSSHPDIGGIYMSTGDIAACIEIVKKYGVEHKAKIVCNDISPKVKQGMKEGIIDFTIVQNPYQQGYRSLRVLYDIIFTGKKPEQEYIFTETSIKILESL